MRRGIWQVGSGPTSLESMRGDKDEDALSEDDDCIGSWLSQGCGWTGRFGAGWRRGLSITFGADSRNGRSTERCTFGHNRFFEATEKLDVQTGKSTDAFAVARCKIGLEKSSRSNINGDTYRQQVLEVGYLEKNSDFIILYQI